jgi:hypothetical protein
LNTGSCLRQFGSWKWSCTHDAYMYPVKVIFETVKLTLATTQIQYIYYYSSAGWKQLWNGLRIEKKLEAQWAGHVSLTFHSVLRKLNTEPSIGASHQVAVQLAKQFQWGKIFKNLPTWNKNFLWQPCLFKTDGEEISNLYRGPSINASYQVSIHLAVVSGEKIFRNQPIRSKNYLWWPCLLSNRDEMSNLYRGPYNDASYQISVYLGKQFQRRIFV